MYTKILPCRLKYSYSNQDIPMHPKKSLCILKHHKVLLGTVKYTYTPPNIAVHPKTLPCTPKIPLHTLKYPHAE